MVKGRMRTLNTDKHARDRTRPSTARGYGAVVPTTYRYRPEEKISKPIT